MHVYDATKKTNISFIFDISPRKDIKNKRQTERKRETRIPFLFKNKTNYFIYIFLRIYQGLKISIKYYFK